MKGVDKPGVTINRVAQGSMEDITLRPFQTFDSLARTEFYDSRRNRTRADEPIRRLMLAVLESAVRDYVENVNAFGRQRQLRFQQASQWFATRGSDAPFSFTSICDAFEIDPDYLRRGLFESSTNRSLEVRRLQLTRRSPVMKNRQIRRRSRTIPPQKESARFEPATTKVPDTNTPSAGTRLQALSASTP